MLSPQRLPPVSKPTLADNALRKECFVHIAAQVVSGNTQQKPNPRKRRTNLTEHIIGLCRIVPNAPVHHAIHDATDRKLNNSDHQTAEQTAYKQSARLHFCIQ